MLVTFVRHSESTNNVLSERCRYRRLEFELTREPDPLLSDRGQRQTAAVAARIAAEQGGDCRMVIASYTRRALQTGQMLVAAIRDANPASSATLHVRKDFCEVGGNYESHLVCEDGSAVELPDDAADIEGYAMSAGGKFGHRGIPGITASAAVAEFGGAGRVVTYPEERCEHGWWTPAAAADAKESLQAGMQRARRAWDQLTAIARTGEHKSVVVVTHGHLYALMMHVALGWFVAGPAPSGGLAVRIPNAGITRVLVEAALSSSSLPSAGDGALCEMTDDPAQPAAPQLVLLQECDATHLAAVGSLHNKHTE